MTAKTYADLNTQITTDIADNAGTGAVTAALVRGVMVNLNDSLNDWSGLTAHSSPVTGEYFLIEKTDGLKYKVDVANMPGGGGGGGGGDVLGTGTPVDNEVAIWTQADTIEGDSNFTFDGSALTVTGSISVTAGINGSKGSDIPSASSIDVGAADYFDVTGTTTITALATEAEGMRRTLQFDGILTLTHNATSLILPTAANITTAAGDTAEFVSLGSGNWKCVSYQRADGTPVSGGSGDVTAAAVITDHAIVRGDGGAKGVQETGLIVDDAGNLDLPARIDEVLGSSVASSATPDIGDVDGNYIEITGTTTITGFTGSVNNGARRILKFAASLTLTHNTSTLPLPRSADIVTLPGDVATFVKESASKWRCINYSQVQGAQVLPIRDDLVLIEGASDTTKQLRFEIDGQTTGTVGLIATTFTTTKTITLPDAVDTLVGKATTDTLTNKTIDANGTGNSISNIDVADLANGTDGELITWDAAGAPATVAVGTSGHVLTSNGAGAAPTFQAAAGGGGLNQAGSGTFTETGAGGNAGGDAENATYCIIEASGDGTFAFGECSQSATNAAYIQSTSKGSFAFGKTLGTSGHAKIVSSSYGSFAGGWAKDGTITATGGGSMAFGYAYGYNIQSGAGKGNLAIGAADSEQIVASGSWSCFQFGAGTNSLSQTLSVGTTMRFKGTTGAPGALRNGDMWVNSGYVYVRSNGTSVKIVACP